MIGLLKTRAFRRCNLLRRSCFSWVLSGLVVCLAVSCADRGRDRVAQMSALKVGPNNRHFVTQSGDPVFLNAETAWRIGYQLDTVTHF